MLTTVRERIAAAAGAGYVVLVGVGNQINVSGTDQSVHPTGDAVLADAAQQAGSTAARIGTTTEFLGLLVLLVFLGYLAAAGRERPGSDAGRIGAGVAVAAGVTTVAVKLASVAPVGALLLDRDAIDPDLARVLGDMNGVSFVLSWLPFAVFVAAAAAALHGAGLIGRPTLYLGTLIGLAGVVLGLLGLAAPLAANPVAFLLALLWTLVVSIRLAIRPGTGSSAGASASDAPAAALATARD